jgi:capsular polysaccharide transport system permease protein
MRLRGLTRALIFVRGDNPVPAPRRADTLIVGTGTRLVPTVYDGTRTRRRRRTAAMALCVGLPTVLAALYYGLFASDRYVSETRMVLSASASGGGVSSLGKSSSSSSLLSMVGISPGGDSTADDQAMVSDYLQSTEAMDAADRAIGLRKMWSSPSVDLWSRLSPDASAERFQHYFQRHVTISADPADPVIRIQVEAFRPADARLIGKTLVRLGQQKVNSAYDEMREDSLGFARSEVTRAEQRLGVVNDKIRSFRNTHGDIDPTATAGAVGTVAGTTFGELSGTEAQLETALSYARPDSPMVKALEARIAALKKQMTADRGLLAGGHTNRNYANLLAEYENLLLDQKFAETAYTSALAFLDSSRAATMHQHTYLIDFIKPTLPEEATEPQAKRNVLLVFVASFLAYLIVSLITSTLREHAHH